MNDNQLLLLSNKLKIVRKLILLMKTRKNPESKLWLKDLNSLVRKRLQTLLGKGTITTQMINRSHLSRLINASKFCLRAFMTADDSLKTTHLSLITGI